MLAGPGLSPLNALIRAAIALPTGIMAAAFSDVLQRAEAGRVTVDN